MTMSIVMLSVKPDVSSAYGIDVLNDLFKHDKVLVPIHTNAHENRVCNTPHD